MRLEFAQCIRDNGVKDFPDPAKVSPSSTRSASHPPQQEGGMTILNAAMQTCGDLAAQATGREARRRGCWPRGRPGRGIRHRRRGRDVQCRRSDPGRAGAAGEHREGGEGELSAMVSLHGTLTYRARSDGSPYSAINQARGIYTRLPDDGDKVDCGDVLYRVDDDPVLLLCGTVPAYRDLAHRRRRATTSVSSTATCTSSATTRRRRRSPGRRSEALEELQHDKGLDETGALDIDDAVFLPEVGADRQGDRRARWIRPAGCTGRAGHIRHARGAGGPRGVAAG